MEQFIGCDAHKEFSVFVAVNEKGQAGEALRVTHDREVYREFLARLPAQSTIAVEATGHYAWLVDEMEALGHHPRLANPFEATRYHSLVIRPGTLNADFEVAAWTKDDEIMGVRHKTWPLHGVQFHPESFLTMEGPKLLANFLRM